MSPEIIKKVVEAALLASGEALNLDRLLSLFAAGDQQPERDAIKQALKEIEDDCADRGIELKKVASGYRLQIKQDMAPWVARLWEERPQRYTRALLETLALIAYRQPVTRAEIEDVRGVAVSSNIIKTLTEREWVRVVGHRDVPGKPALYGTTKTFLDYFGLKALDELPPLAELRDYDTINAELDLELPGLESPQTGEQAGSGQAEQAQAGPEEAAAQTEPEQAADAQDDAQDDADKDSSSAA
ncbi:MAG: SMC-Scp complex subunit ScpB [Granulosicoccaceae bacterium]|jgi:segregation and condensation protein B